MNCWLFLTSGGDSSSTSRVRVAMTAVVGGAVIPYLLGALADRVGIQMSFVLPVICYVYIAFYGFVGHKPTRTIAA